LALRVGLLGAGTVGAQVLRALERRGGALAAHAGVRLVPVRALVRDPARQRGRETGTPLVTDPNAVVVARDIDVVVELIGGLEPAGELIRRALEAGQHVVTANKAVMATRGPELLALAARREAELFYEAAVGGGIPLISTLGLDLAANDITSLVGIINGTTNFILDRMARTGQAFSEALAEAQAMGYAEADPSADVDGWDAAYKLAIMSALAFQTPVPPEDIPREGISDLSAKDFRFAHELGYSIKLLATGQVRDGQVELAVRPTLVPLDRLLGQVPGPLNAVEITGDLVGTVLLQGPGAGGEPTASAVLADLLTLAQNHRAGVRRRAFTREASPRPLRPAADRRTKAYYRLVVEDRAGVLAGVTRVLGDLGISIAAIVQKEADLEAGTAELVLMTHQALEGRLSAARDAMATQPAVLAVASFLRVAD
jgi:homoserine dehydrogenase